MKLKKNKNILPLRDLFEGDERKEEMLNNILLKGTPLPPIVTYEDIDNSIREWVENKINLDCESEKVPTMVLMTNQKFSEYSQSWKYVDEDKNLLLNFKTITRQTNPQKGTIYGDVFNIPENTFFKIGSEKKLDKDGQSITCIYEMKQPMPIDFTYNISLFTNKIILLNDFNTVINNLFKGIQSYIAPKGHHMSIELLNIDDKSDYNLDDRTFYSQSLEIKVKGYVIQESDIRIREIPDRIITMFDGGINRNKKNTIEIEEDERYVCNEEEEEIFYYKPLKIIINFDYCNNTVKFNIDTDMVITHFKTHNIKKYIFYVNDVEIFNLKDFKLNKNDEIKIKITQNNVLSPSKFKIHGYDPNIIYDKKDDASELFIDEKNKEGKIIINEF